MMCAQEPTYLLNGEVVDESHVMDDRACKICAAVGNTLIEDSEETKKEQRALKRIIRTRHNAEKISRHICQYCGSRLSYTKRYCSQCKSPRPAF